MAHAAASPLPRASFEAPPAAAPSYYRPRSLEEALENYQAYLAGYDDEGNAWGRMADVLEQLGRVDEARDALTRGIAAAQRHGHPSMAAEMEERLEGLEES